MRVGGQVIKILKRKNNVKHTPKPNIEVGFNWFGFPGCVELIDRKPIFVFKPNRNDILGIKIETIGPV